jgi:photosystem II stability/assembly factor-like uncharacterized protein
MKNRLLKITAIVLILLSVFLINRLYRCDDKPEPGKIPNDWGFMQRSFPYDDINHTAYREAIEQAAKKREEYNSRDSRVSWEFAGPVNIGGRVTSVTMHPSNQEVFYIGNASGGVLKTEDAGNSFTSIFDDQPSLSIGDVALAPSNPEIIYVGTGEANPGGGSLSYDGLGIFRSDDGGSSWTDLGLHESGSVGRLVVHPQNPDICYVAAMGRMFSTNEQRGVFKTTDGGQNWEKVLYLTDSTGAIDIVIHPNNPDTLFACMWERTRQPDKRHYGGESCGVYRTYDGGENWTELTNGLPGGENVGRIGISISQSDPEILYTIYADKTGYFDGVFKTTDNGDSWTQTNDGSMSNIYSSYGWWFGRLRVDPTDPDIVFAIGYDLFRTTNGGNSWSNIGWSVHVDQHALNAHPLNNDFVVLGNDGGVYTSQNGGNTWTHLENLPNIQFYTSEIDYQNPDRLYGGAQDNGTNRTMTGDLDDWYSIYGGDGFYVLVNPQNNQYVYANFQYGGLGRSTNGGSSFQGATNGLGSDRFNWMSPLVFNPNNPSTLYYGGSKVYKSTNHAASWSAISPDLTNGPGQYNQTYGTVTTISVSPVNDEIIYAGTDDGNVWLTQNDGGNWTKISNAFQLPVRWVTRVAADPWDEATAYVTFSGYRYDEYMPHIFRTTDFGQTWIDISGDLPEAPINDIIVDPAVDSALYIATDVGTFVSWNLGQNWGLMGEGLPNVPVCDLTFHDELRMLVAATYGRSMYKIYLADFVGLNEIASKANEIEIYPNPVSDVLMLEFNSINAGSEFQIMNVSGKQVMAGSLDGTAKNQMSVAGLKAGSYFIRVGSGTGYLSGKFIKK